MPYKETGTCVLKGIDDVIGLLDDHIVKTQTMLGSPFARAIAGRCKGWEKRLQDCQTFIDECMNTQRTWMYLEPIFSSPDIKRQMPVEASRFSSVDAVWRRTIAEAAKDPSVLAVAGLEGIIEKFVGANKKLDAIQKGLNDYLEIKRLYFPRFFFLSNDELLEILSQTKDPKAVQ